MKVLVCGGRNFDDFRVMTNYLNTFKNITMVINGGARGADTLSTEWACDNKIPVEVYPANWERDGKAAGFIRNVFMLEDSKPDIVVAFPGGNGTKHMVEFAKSKGVRVFEVTDVNEWTNKNDNYSSNS